MQTCPGEPSQWPFVGEANERDGHVDDLQDRYRFHRGVEVLGEEVEEELGPEEAFYCSGKLVWTALSVSCASDTRFGDLGPTACGREDYESGPVVLYQLAHAAARRREPASRQQE